MAVAKGPGVAMMSPVEGVVRFMTTRDASRVPDAFARRDVVIVENFAPHVFRGAGAVKRWAAAFAEHARRLDGLRATFGPARDFVRTGDRTYFTLPTTWTGSDAGREFVETGAWTFVLVREGRRWRIAAYAWGVTDFHYAR
jgi:hypothetical protein